MNGRKPLISAVLLTLALLASSQDVTVRAALDTNRGLIGDQFTLRLIVEKPSDDWQVIFPVVSDSMGKQIEVIDVKPVDSSAAGNRQVLTQDLLLTVFDTGFFEIPALPFAIASKGFSDTLTTLPVGFEILSMAADSTIRDIKGIYRVPVSFREMIPWIAGVLITGLLVWLLIRYVRNRKTVIIGKKIAVPAEAPDLIALRELARLRDEKPWLDNRIKYYYSRISEILRTYIEGRYHVLALEQTTGEILLELKHLQTDPDEMKRISEILNLADFVKFAKVIPDPEQNSHQVGYAEQFVHGTSRQNIVPDQSPEELVDRIRT